MILALLGFLKKNPWLTAAVIVIALLSGALVYEVVRKSMIINQQRETIQDTEAALLEANGFATSMAFSSAALERQLGELKPEVDRLRKALDAKPKVKEVIKWRTEEVPVYAGGETTEVECPDGTIYNVPCPEVRVAVEGAEARLETEGNNIVALGEVTIIRTTPLPEERFTVPFRVEQLSVEAPKPQRVRWDIGPAGAISDTGWQLGAMAAAPPLRLWRVEARPVFGVMIGPGGGYTATAGLLFGWLRQ